ncbi:MAG TPA: S8 family peptidase [Salinimicrobium sp.]|nr:S8 family peptidase [Salinimicrobium sp.]
MKKIFTTRLIAMVFAMAFFMVSCSKDEEISTETSEMQQVKPFYSQPIPGQYIIVYKENGDTQGKYADRKMEVQEKTQELLSKNGIPSAKILNTYSAALKGATVKISEAEVNLLRGNEEIAYIEQDRILALAPPCGTPNGGPCDPGDGGGDDGSSDGDSTQEIPYGITRVNGISSYTGSNVAWILDSGIDLDHPDLNVDASRGFNAFTSGKDGQSLDDGNGHGSHVAGTIAALNNSIGVVGVAPGATVVPVKVLNSRGSGSYSGVIAGVDHVAAHGSNGDVANMSLGGPVSQALDDAILSASQNGIKFALASGNESTDANSSSPSRVNGSNIYTISAMDSNDNWAYFSNYGNPPVDYCAPGVNVTSTWKNGGYNTISGTSMASPHAAGVLLLGNASTDGTVSGDPDGNADPIIVH